VDGACLALLWQGGQHQPRRELHKHLKWLLLVTAHPDKSGLCGTPTMAEYLIQSY